MNKQSNQYAHDVIGAVARGHYRQQYKHIRECLYHGALRMGSGMKLAEPLKAFSITLSMMIEEAIRQGADPQKLQENLIRKGEDRSIEQAIRGAKNEHEDYEENPANFAVNDWEEFDKVVDELDEESLRNALKREARIRAEAQREANVPGGGKP